MKLLAVIASSLALSGCAWQQADRSDIEKAIHFCGGLQNIDELSIWALSSGSVLCLDGTYERLHVISIPRKEQK